MYLIEVKKLNGRLLLTMYLTERLAIIFSVFSTKQAEKSWHASELLVEKSFHPLKAKFTALKLE